MKYVLQVLAALGAIAFVMSIVIRYQNMSQLLNASAVGWWRASIALLVISIAFAVIEILGEHKKK